MTVLIFSAVGALLALFTFMVIWSRKDTWARPASIVLFLAAVPGLAYASIETLGFHRPLKWAWGLSAGDQRVLAAKMVQDVAIYLYIDDPQRAEPWPLQLPWSNELAEAIAKAQDQSQRDGNGGQFLFRFDPSLETHAPQVHPLPQPKLPIPKSPEPAPKFYGQEL